MSVTDRCFSHGGGRFAPFKEGAEVTESTRFSEAECVVSIRFAFEKRRSTSPQSAWQRHTVSVTSASSLKGAKRPPPCETISDGNRVGRNVTDMIVYK
ncbi:MAG TPA: hypothetical protein VHB27_00270, partial [Rhodopila sp.]|uniref:hypothetical protein n=1 Tax=Rhodopila sp. TaxID=2480087 RepID=UPI002C35C412